MPQYTIGSLAKSCGLRPDTIRYYERLGLIESSGRKGNGYQVFTDDSLARLQFIRRAKLLKFTLEEIKDLFLMRSAPTSNCEQIYQRLSGKITDIDAQIVELASFKRDLQTIARQCPRGSAPLADCSLMDFLNKPAPCCADKKIQKSKLKPKNVLGKALMIFALCFLSAAAQAKPIPYTGGWMIIQKITPRKICSILSMDCSLVFPPESAVNGLKTTNIGSNPRSLIIL